MREHRIAGVHLRRRHHTTIVDPAAPRVADLLERDFTATAPNQKHVGDITYLPAAGGRPLYPATVIDLCSRRLAGFAIAEHMRTELVLEALADAERTRGSLAGAIFHADHGSQYTSNAFATACVRAGVRRSMAAIGSSADNAAAEAFNATVKRETLQGASAWPNASQARLDAFARLTRYNTPPRHSRLGQRSPLAYEMAPHRSSTTLAQAAQIVSTPRGKAPLRAWVLHTP